MTSRSATANRQRARSGLLGDARGITQAEYLVLFVVIVVGTLGAWVAFGKDLADVFVEQDKPTNSGAVNYMERNVFGRSGGSSSGANGSSPLAQVLSPQSWTNAARNTVNGVVGEVGALPGAVLGEAKSAATSAIAEGKNTISNLPQTATTAAGKALGDALSTGGAPRGNPASNVSSIVSGGGSPGGGPSGGDSPGGASGGGPQIGSRVPPPSTPAAFPDVERAKPKTSVQGGGGKRKRWKDNKGNIYEWDSQHGTVEKYNKSGKHLGEFDPDTGEMLKPADPTRRVEP
jgi:hypothetical protein